MTTRRGVLRSLVAAGGSGALAACLDGETVADVPQGDPANRPTRQHAWNERLRRDDDRNFLPQQHHVYLYLNYRGDGIEADRETVETALVDLETAFEASHRGLLFTLGYSAAYFEERGRPVDLPHPESIVPGENVSLDDADALLHLASDTAHAVLEAEEALFGDRETANDVNVTDLSDVFAVERRRTGFFGAGKPSQRKHLNGLPADQRRPNPVPDEAPLFMGFRSGFRRNQATEDRVTIQEGRFAGGTTQHVSGIKLNLTSWFDLDGDTQVAKMFDPDLTFDDIGEAGTNLADHNGVTDQTDTDLVETANSDHIVGHAQKVARVREDGRPPIIRRDVNSDDLGEAGIVFVALQRDIEDFVRTRQAMTGRDVVGEGGVGDEVNNGILEYIQTRHRGNFLIPPREKRSLPV